MEWKCCKNIILKKNISLYIYKMNAHFHCSLYELFHFQLLLFSYIKCKLNSDHDIQYKQYVTVKPVEMITSNAVIEIN